MDGERYGNSDTKPNPSLLKLRQTNACHYACSYCFTSCAIKRKRTTADAPAEDPTRALRLYQSDFMLRDYGFSYAELPFDEQGLLPRDKTPKQAWAEHNLHEPIEVNRASRQQLQRVPGIGPKSADKIIASRREARLRDLSQLKALGVTTGWAAPYVLLDGRRTPEQLRFW